MLDAKRFDFFRSGQSVLPKRNSFFFPLLIYTVPPCNSEEAAVMILCHLLSISPLLTCYHPLTYISLSLILSLSITLPLLAPNNERISIGLRFNTEEMNMTC